MVPEIKKKVIKKVTKRRRVKRMFRNSDSEISESPIKKRKI